jgi:hypothetical protein
MIHFFREVRTLREEGKLHKKLISRLRILFVISLLLAGIVVFNIVARGANPLIAAFLAALGILLGFFVFSRMSAVHWNEEEKVVQISKMDILGYVTLGLYIAFEIGFRTFLSDFFPIATTAYLLAGIFGTLFGRVMGMVTEIHKVYRFEHPGT